MKRFVKGQTIYYASYNFGEKDGKRISAVVSRVVDACGEKQVTFIDQGFDSVYGRKNRADSADLFETAEEAFEYLRSSRFCEAFVTDVYSDSEKTPFDLLEKGTLSITVK